VSQTATPVQLDQILSSLRSANRKDLLNVLGELGDSLDHGGAEALNASLPDWGPTFARGAQAMEALRGQRPDDLSGAIAESQTVTTALADRREDLADALTGLAQTSGALAARREELARSIPEFDRLVTEASPTFASLNGLFPTARAFVAEARPGIREAPATLRLANPLLTQLQGLLSPAELPRLISAGTPAIRSLARLQPNLRDLLALVTPVTDCAQRVVVPTLKTSIVDPPLTDGKPELPVYREVLNGLVGLSSASQTFDGNGPNLRYHAGFGDETFGTGTIPSVGEALAGTTSEELLGSRPRYTGNIPPYRPNVPCRDQKRPDLNGAETGPAFSTPAGPRIVPRQTP
jgi:hypothetical protein